MLTAIVNNGLLGTSKTNTETKPMTTYTFEIKEDGSSDWKRTREFTADNLALAYEQGEADHPKACDIRLAEWKV